MTCLKPLDSPPFIATYRWAGSFDGRYMPQAYSLLQELNHRHYIHVLNGMVCVCSGTLNLVTFFAYPQDDVHRIPGVRCGT